MAEAGGAALQGVLARLATLEVELADTRAELAEAKRLNLAPGGVRDWAKGLPADVLMKVAGKVVAQTEARWAAQLKVDYPTWPEKEIQKHMAKRKRDGNCLFVFTRVCKEWRKAQLGVGGPLCTRVRSNVILPGSVALAKWALAEGCPRDDGYDDPLTMAHYAAHHAHGELVNWLCAERGFAMDEGVMAKAARSGNLELVQFLRGEGCPWSCLTCWYAVDQGHVEVLRWARENGCPWYADVRDWAAEKLGYTDNLGNLL